MQGNTTEIDERNLLRLDALLSHGYGLSPQLVMRSKGLSIEAKALYGYLSSFAGAGDTAFPSTSRILEELDISKNRFYKIRKELVSWGFISIETTATSAGLRTVYTLPQNPIAIKTEIDEIANRRNEIKSSLVANLHNEDMVSHKGDSESERLQQSAGNEPCRQSEAKAQNRGSNLKPCLQSEDEGCLQSGDKLYIDTNINPKVSIDRSAAHPSDDEGPSDWKVTEGMTDPTQRDDGESDTRTSTLKRKLKTSSITFRTKTNHAYAWIVKEPNMQPKFLYCRAIDDPANDRGWNIIAEVWERDVLGGWGISSSTMHPEFEDTADGYVLAEGMPGTAASLPYQVFREVVNEHDTNYLIALAIAIDALPKDSTCDMASETIRANADIDIAERRKSVLPDQAGLAAKKASCIESLAHIGGNAPVCRQNEIAR